jgi:hypothetical protein
VDPESEQGSAPIKVLFEPIRCFIDNFRRIEGPQKVPASARLALLFLKDRSRVMTIDRSVATVTTVAVAPVTLSSSVRQSIFFYLGILIVLLAFGGPSGGLIDIPISFFLKNKLQLSAHEVANFRLVAAIPLYLSFVFGFIRDMWNPFGMRDRGFMLLFGTITAILYVLFAFTPITYVTLLVAVILLTTSFLSSQVLKTD